MIGNLSTAHNKTNSYLIEPTAAFLFIPCIVISILIHSLLLVAFTSHHLPISLYPKMAIPPRYYKFYWQFKQQVEEAKGQVVNGEPVREVMAKMMPIAMKNCKLMVHSRRTHHIP